MVMEVALWWLALEIIGFVCLPITSRICRDLKDCGYSISKPLGLLLLTYGSWVISVFFGYTAFSVLLPLGIISVCSFIIWRNGFSCFQKDYIIKFEILFFLAFVVFAFIRAYSPDIYWTGGEKFMDMTFINSFLRISQFPPSDPWMSGTAMHYYYLGYLIVADLIKITGILPSIAFNLATASFFALSVTSAFGIGYNLTGKIGGGVITAFFVAIAGNLVGFFQLMYMLIQNAGALYFDYWASSRVIPYTINEFPFFSFLQGDVHAHMISITFQLLIILLLLNIFKSLNIYPGSIFVLAASIGFLYPLNTWDYPVYLILALFIIAFRFLLRQCQPHRSIKEYTEPILAIGATAVLSYVMYLPYHFSYKLDRSISIVTSGRTALIFYVAIYGLFLYFIYSFILEKSAKYNKYFKIPSLLLLIVAVILVLESRMLILNINNLTDIIPEVKISEFELFILLIPLLILSMISILKEKDEKHVFVLVLIITGIFISLFCELFYIKDALGSGNPAYVRLNTVFKLYLQNWILWGVSAGAILYFSQRRKWGIAAAVMILMVSVYPVFATIGKSGGFNVNPSLDGEAYVKKQHPQEYEAILWLRNISGQPVVVQAPGELYKWNTYITAFTGLPTVIGWAGHEINWRASPSEINTRWSDVGTIYTSFNLDDVDALLKKYNVSYIYFGEAETGRYGSPKLFASHPERFENVYEYGDVTIYRVKH